MSEAFLKVVNMSISAGWLVLAVLALRLILKKVPKWVNVLLWGIVAIRLICPFSIESALSLIPSRETISPEIMMDWTPEITTGIAPIDQAVNPVISTSFAPSPGASVNPLQILIPVAANLWLLVVLILLAYTAISYLSLRSKLRTAVILRDNIFQCETVSSPFVLGILKPRIYLPYNMDGQNLHHVVAHEQAHINRKDHWWKPLGFLLLTVYWFNPLMWVAYILLCRDIELACDEKVIAKLGNDQRAEYTQALVACAVNRRMIAACPLAFGEVGVKDRVKSIMNYRKPTFWIIVTALIVCLVVAVCFLTDPNPSREFSMNGNNISDLDPEAIVERILDVEDWESGNVYMNSMNFSLHVDSNFNWMDSQTVSYFFSNAKHTYGAQLRIFPEEGKYFLTEPTEWQEQSRIFLLQHYLEAIKYLPQYEIMQMAPADRYIISHVDGGSPSDYERVIRYSSYGVEETDGWFIHLQIQPLHWDGEGYRGTGEEVIEAFYGGTNDLDADNMVTTENRLDEFILLAANTSISQQILLSDDKPYWSIFVANQGKEDIVVDVDGFIYLIPAGSSTTLCNDDGWSSGSYPVCFATKGSLGMEGYAIMEVSSVPVRIRQPLSMESDASDSHVNPAGASRIDLTVENASTSGLKLLVTPFGSLRDEKLIIGVPYFLQKNEGNFWESIPPKLEAFGWDSEELEIPANETIEHQINWEWLYGELEQGQYRIGIYLYTELESGAREQNICYAEFEIS